VLISSRDPIAKIYFSTNVTGADLELFSDADGACLLKARTQHDDVTGVVKKYHRLGRLSLALTQMAPVFSLLKVITI
jgi:hypothetical protein